MLWAMAFWNRRPRVVSAEIDAHSDMLVRPDTRPPEDELDYGHSPLRAAQIAAEARAPFIQLKPETHTAWVDSRVFTAMVAAERVLEQNGDLWDGIVASTEYYADGLIITHKDRGIQKAYRDFATRANLDFWLADSHGTSLLMGNAYLVFAGDGPDCMVYAMNPKVVAVGSQYHLGKRPLAYMGGNATALYQELFHQGVAIPAHNEWPEFDIDNEKSSGVMVDPARVYHRYVFKPSYKRYGLPPAIRAWDQIADRMTVGKMIRATASGMKTQIRVWKIKNPRPDSVSALTSQIESMKASRSYDLITRTEVDVDQIMPKTVSELLADETWMSMTDRCFRAMGLSLILTSGERMSGNSGGGGQSSDSDIQLMVAINRLKAEQQANLRIATWVLSMYAQHGSDARLAKTEAPRVYYRETLLGMDQRVRAVVPLLNYGAIPIRSVHEYLGMDSEIEMQRLKEELPLRRDGTISPYLGFGQTAGANGGSVVHQQSPGRPIGPDVQPENSETNRANATNGRRP